MQVDLLPIVPGLEDRLGSYRGGLILDEWPWGDGSTPRIAGYELPFICKYGLCDPADQRPRLVVDYDALDIPIELLEGKEIEFA